MISTNMLLYRSGRYGWLALALLIGAGILFSTQDASAPPGGSTWQGYTLGSVCALLVIWLTMLGIRKRSYHASGQVRGWVSAHVYLGTSLLGVATFHSAGQLGWNIHSATYWLLVTVVVSGMTGTFLYLVLPRRAAENKKDRSREDFFKELGVLNASCLELSIHCSPSTELAIHSSISGTVVGGGLWNQLLAIDHSTFCGASDVHEVDSSRPIANRGQSQILQFVASRAPRASTTEEASAMTELVSLIARRQELLRRIRKDIQFQGWLKVWLFVHVPVAVALLVALFIHVFVVFFYW